MVLVGVHRYSTLPDSVSDPAPQKFASWIQVHMKNADLDPAACKFVLEPKTGILKSKSSQK
jgi:hypothetical protein